MQTRYCIVLALLLAGAVSHVHSQAAIEAESERPIGESSIESKSEPLPTLDVSPQSDDAPTSLSADSSTSPPLASSDPAGEDPSTEPLLSSSLYEEPSGKTFEPAERNVMTSLFRESLDTFTDFMSDIVRHTFQVSELVLNKTSETLAKDSVMMLDLSRAEVAYASCALLLCLLSCYICNKQPESFAAKILRFINLFALLNGALKMTAAFFKSLVKAPEKIEIQINADNAGAYSMQGRRGGMEDRFTLKTSAASEFGIEFYAVYDGHGGANAAEYAERELFTRITRRIRLLISDSVGKKDSVPTTQKVKARTPLKEVKNLLNRVTATDLSRFEALTVNELKKIINEEIVSFDEQLLEEYSAKQDISGTTALIVVRLLRTNTLIVANVGDSRAILCDWKNSCIPLSFDHKPDKLKEYRRVMEAGGCIVLRGVFRVNGILAVSRAIGDYPLKTNRVVIPDPDILTFELDDLRPRFMIIASDGFWDTFSNENAVQFVRSELSHYGTNYVARGANLAVAIAKKLAQEAYERESYDNITVIVVLFEEMDGLFKSRVGYAKKSK